jgi:hypothetical protein
MTTPTSNPEETVSPHQQPETTSAPAASVDDPSHPLHHHRRTVTDFDYGEAIGEGSYSTVSSLMVTLLLWAGNKGIVSGLLLSS